MQRGIPGIRGIEVGREGSENTENPQSTTPSCLDASVPGCLLCQTRRLRPGPYAWFADATDAGRLGPRHAGVHEPRTSPRRDRVHRPPHRPLFGRRGPLRNAHRPHAVPEPTPRRRRSTASYTTSPSTPENSAPNADPVLASLALRLMAKRCSEDRLPSASEAMRILDANRLVGQPIRRRVTPVDYAFPMAVLALCRGLAGDAAGDGNEAQSVKYG